MKSQRGFTLLEVMIATSIMAIGIVGALELFSGSMRLAGNSDQQSRAVVLARALVDEELWRDVLEDSVRTGTDGGFSWSVTTHPIERGMIGRNEEESELHDLESEFGLWLIQAEVGWEAQLGHKTVALETARLGQLPE